MASKICPNQDGSGWTNDDNGNHVYLSKRQMEALEQQGRDYLAFLQAGHGPPKKLPATPENRQRMAELRTEIARLEALKEDK